MCRLFVSARDTAVNKVPVLTQVKIWLQKEKHVRKQKTYQMVMCVMEENKAGKCLKRRGKYCFIRGSQGRPH
jgi:hypothetical protein